MVTRAQHKHVTEREVAHRWPNGQYDNAAWEDCTFMSGVELARLCFSSKIPATHYEGERLRQAAGVSPSGGSNIDDLRNGIKRRYRRETSHPVSGFGNLWRVLTPGRAAVAQGRMSAVPRLRRWSTFTGKHAVLVVRVDATDRVWWCDPLAPAGAYAGQWVTKAELKRYVDAITAEGGRHLVANVRRNYYAMVVDGARLYVRQDLKPTAKDVIIKPGPRPMPYKGQVTLAAKKVEYVNSKGVHTGSMYYVKNAAVRSVYASG
jgi:hypothetical protein